MTVLTKKPNPVDIEVGSRIRLRRNLIGMSQTTLAEGLGVTFQQVQKYEKGTNRVGASRLQAIASMLQVPVSYFFAAGVQEQHEIGKDNEVVRFISTSDGLNLNKAFSRIKETGVRKSVINLVTALSGVDREPVGTEDPSSSELVKSRFKGTNR